MENKGKLRSFAVKISLFATLSFLLIGFPVVAVERVETKWVSTSPQLTEWLFELGMGDKVVATSEYSDSPESAKKIPRLGPLFAPSIEKTLRINPNLVWIDGTITPAPYRHALKALAIPQKQISFQNFDSLFADSEKIASEIGSPQTTARLIRLRRCATALQKQSRKSFRFLALVWLTPPILFSSQTLLSDLLTRLGGTNIFSARRSPDFPQVSLEWLWEQSPDRLYLLADSTGAIDQAKEKMKTWWPQSRPTLVPLSTEIFSRSNFSPLTHLKMLFPNQNYLIPEECVAVQS